ncbi:dihydroorotate dehydrogenase electron transfer subunit [Vibrio sp. MA40-2]|uniref:dihydroorotate dehydrogenase electron transfer subunit n=1 Tax=Vibrio sp. MA40-2 TaxID=3391828 RepID=UPI0039A4EB2C
MNIPIREEIENKFHIHQASCKVKQNLSVNSDYRHLILDAPKEILDIQPGQFFQILCPTIGTLQPYLRRPMSIYAANKHNGELHFLYKVQGEGTNAMSELNQGQEISVVGPLGRGFDILPTYRHIVLVARGVGLATLAPLADLAQQKGCKVTAICSARSPELLMSIDYFRSKGVNVITLTDSEGTSDMDNMQSVIQQVIENEQVDCFYTCGSKRIQHLLQKLSQIFTIPGQVALEQQMACGIGMCFCCVKPFKQGNEIVSKRVCKEGPVFDLQGVIL